MSTAVKRKLDELDDSDDEEPMLGRQVLPVANMPDTFDGVPVDGMQYLFTVRQHARSLPHITRVANPYEVPEAHDTRTEEEPPQVRKPLLPSEEWRGTFLKRFKNFRKNSVQPTIHVHRPDSSAKMMPDKKERDLWWAFLAGRPECEWNPPKKPKLPKISRWQQRNLKQGRNVGDLMPDAPDNGALPYDLPEAYHVRSDDTSALPLSSVVHGDLNPEAGFSPSNASEILPTDTASGSALSTEDSRDAYVPREPTPAVLRYIDNRYALHLLMYFGHWINVRLEAERPHTEITQAHARWIFSLLARVDDWISGDETSQLRNLARGCIGLLVERRKHAVEKEASGQASLVIDERSCWMIMTIVTGLWGQSDLWMDVDSELTKVESGPI